MKMIIKIAKPMSRYKGESSAYSTNTKGLGLSRSAYSENGFNSQWSMTSVKANHDRSEAWKCYFIHSINTFFLDHLIVKQNIAMIAINVNNVTKIDFN